ncbi:hypothetical protein [Candidatus Protofrankia californiensis]|uniref:hypothetical protein n=1 Tax=Candidatus Protofrankia californiensis TaxID=1839754 RepID=UPI0010415F43|nr:hypothetical protein [Candidatus Protofrankia californiensis]
MLLPLVLIGLLLMHGGLAAILEPSRMDHAAAPTAPTPHETTGAMAAAHGRMPAAAEHPDHVGPLCLAVLRVGLATAVAGLLLGLLGACLAGCPVRSATPGVPGGNRRAPPSRSPPSRPPTLAELCVLRL